MLALVAAQMRAYRAYLEVFMADIGEKVLVHCVGTLDDGREVENTRRAGEPLAVTIGAGRLPGAAQTAAKSSTIMPV